jgi:hypothetical protein
MKYMKLPFKYGLILTKYRVTLMYTPNGTDRKDPLLLTKCIWTMGVSSNDNGSPKTVTGKNSNPSR